MSYLILPLLVLAMFYLIYMPQQKQKKAQAALLASLDEGDSVLTTGGIYGVIAEVDGDSVYLEVAPGIEVHGVASRSRPASNCTCPRPQCSARSCNRLNPPLKASRCEKGNGPS